MTHKMTFDTDAIKEVEELTAINNHNEARLVIMKTLVDAGVSTPAVEIIGNGFTEIAKRAETAGYLPYELSILRNDYDDLLKGLLQRHVTNSQDVWGVL